LQKRLLAGDPDPYDYFGWSVALSGDTALIGAPAGGSSKEAAYVFTRSGTSWGLPQQLTMSGGVEPWFGEAVALTSNTALVGAPADDTTGGPNAGSAHVFVGP
jgi:hypothetical protein